MFYCYGKPILEQKKTFLIKELSIISKLSMWFHVWIKENIFANITKMVINDVYIVISRIYKTFETLPS